MHIKIQEFSLLTSRIHLTSDWILGSVEALRNMAKPPQNIIFVEKLCMKS